LIGFAEEISEQRSFKGFGHMGDSGFCCGASLLSLDQTKIYYDAMF
jgi:hypothetical protein